RQLLSLGGAADVTLRTRRGVHLCRTPARGAADHGQHRNVSSGTPTAGQRSSSGARARPNLRGARLAPLALIVLLECSADGSAPTEIAAVDDAPRIDFTIALRWDDLEDRIRAAVTVVNRDALGRDVIFPTCNPTIDILDPEDGRLVWSERRWQAATMSCRPFGPTITVMPGVTIA